MPDSLFHPSFKDMMNDVVEAGSCCECGSCVLVCPHNIIEYVDGNPKQTAKASAAFDYCGISIMSGASLPRVEIKAQMRDPADGIWREAWTPLIVEEDPEYSNNAGTNQEPVYHDTDRLGTWHQHQKKYRSNYYSVSGSVHMVEFAAHHGAVAADDWHIKTPRRADTGILAAGDGGEVDFGWFNSE